MYRVCRSSSEPRNPCQSGTKHAVSDNGGAESITDGTSKFAYPIAAFTWLVIPAHIADPAKRTALVELLRWILTSGQAECSALGYVPIPHELAESELQSLNSF